MEKEIMAEENKKLQETETIEKGIEVSELELTPTFLLLKNNKEIKLIRINQIKGITLERDMSKKKKRLSRLDVITYNTSHLDNTLNFWAYVDANNDYDIKKFNSIIKALEKNCNVLIPEPVEKDSEGTGIDD